MPKFLNEHEIYKIIQQELPEDVYATSTKPETFFTTADDFAFAKVLKGCYSLMARIYDNNFPQTAYEQLDKWEIKVFGELSAMGLTPEQRIERLLIQIRSQKGITKQDMYDIVYSVIGEDKNVEIIEKGNETGSWRLGRSKLSNNTYLGWSRALSIPSTPDICEKSAAELGLTEEELALMKQQAYTLDVRIRDYTLTDLEYARLDMLLTKFEPARSTHRIFSPYVPPVIRGKWKLGRSKLSTRTYLG